MLYAPLVREIEDVRTLCSSLSRPVNFLALPGGPSVAELSEAGVKRVSLGSGFFNAAYGGFLRAAHDVREQGVFDSLASNASGSEIAALHARPLTEPSVAAERAACAAAAGTRRARRRRA